MRADRPAGGRGASYVRVSDAAKQDAKSQTEAIGRWLKEKGLTLSRRYTDGGRRDLAHKRPEFQEMMAAVRRGDIDWIVVDAQDRFGARDSNEFGAFLNALTDNGCELWSTSQGCLTATDDATIITNAIGSITSTREQKDKAQRSLRAKLTAAAAGEWTGGYVPYGLDVVCHTADGRERWRVVVEGFRDGVLRRTKLSPDGTAERYDGRNNFPRKELTDTLRLQPSVRADRLETVRRIFDWYRTESISLRAVCTRLNELGVDPVHGSHWYVSKLKPMLQNPIYVGRPTYNKRSHGRFLEHRDGGYREVERVRGRVKAGRVHAPGEWVSSKERLFDPIVQEDVFEAVREKLSVTKGRPRAVRKPSLWLTGLMVCGRCGKPMRGWRHKDEYVGDVYICSGYALLGKQNPAGCRLHMARAGEIEPIVGEFLDRAGRTARALLDGEDARGLLDRLERELGDKRGELTEKFLRLQQDLDRMVASTHPTDSVGRFAAGEADCEVAALADPAREAELLLGVYEFFYNRSRVDLTIVIAEKEREMDRLFDLFEKLDPSNAGAVERANRRMAALQTEIDGMRAKLEPLTDQVLRVRTELGVILEHIDAAKTAMAGKGEREKAEAARQVIGRIVCHFRHADKGRNRSPLERVEVVPRSGEPQPFHMDSPPGRG